MAVRPRRIALPPGVKPRLPVDIDWQHPLLRGVLYAQWMLNRAGVPAAEIGNRNPVLNSSITWANDGVTFNADGHPQYANSGGWSLAQSEKWTIVGRGTKFTNSSIGFEFFTALVDITNPSVKQVGIGFSNTNAFKILSSGNTPGDDGVAITNGTTVDFALVHQGNGSLSCYKNGNFRYSVTHSAPSELNGINRVWLATNPGGSTGNAVINIEYVLIFRRAMAPAEIRALHADPYAPIRKRRVLVPVASAPADLSGAAQSSATGQASLTADVPISGTAVSVASASGGLVSSVPLTGFGAAASIGSASLQAGADLSGDAQAQATGSGSVALSVRLDGAAVAAAIAQAALSAGVDLSGQAAAGAGGAGALSTGSDLSGAAQGQAAGSGSITIQVTLDGQAVSEALASAGIDAGSGDLSGAAAAGALGAAAMIMDVPVAGSAASVSSADGSLSAILPLEAVAVSGSSATGGLTVQAGLDGQAVANAMASGVLAVDAGSTLGGDAVAESAGSGVLSLRLTLNGAALAEAVASGAVGVQSPVSGASIVDPVFKDAAVILFSFYGRPVLVLPRIGLPNETLAIVENGVDPFGEFGRLAENRRRLSFKAAEVRPQPGDQILMDAETLTVDAVDSDDGMVRSVWVK